MKNKLTKKRNPQDITLKNLRAMRKRIDRLEMLEARFAIYEGIMNTCAMCLYSLAGTLKAQQ